MQYSTVPAYSLLLLWPKANALTQHFGIPEQIRRMPFTALWTRWCFLRRAGVTRPPGTDSWSNLLCNRNRQRPSGVGESRARRRLSPTNRHYGAVQYEVQYLTKPLTPTATTGGSASGLQGPHDAVTAGCVCVSATRVASFALDTTWMAGLFKLQERNLPVPDRPPVMGPIVNGVGSMINSIGRRAQAVSLSALPARAAEEAAPEVHAFFFDRGGAVPPV